MKKIYFSLLCSLTAVTVSAQGVTYSHDDPKMKQITVQEVGIGALTPDVYYWALHNSYRQSAAAKNKLVFRSSVGMAAYQQIDDAKKLDSAMVKRAEIEAGGTALEQKYWQKQAAMFKTAIKATQDAYMPNAQRKKQYLAIYADLTKKNESLVMYISKLSTSMKTSELLRASYNKPNTKAQVVAAAMGRWRSAGWQSCGKSEF